MTEGVAECDSPWHLIPLEDYEQHMALPQIGQAQMLADELARAVSRHSPNSVAVIGCAGGNGFDRLATMKVERIVGIDINPAYVETARRRHAADIAGLELYVADIQSAVAPCRPVELIYAALVLEYVDVKQAMAAFRRLCLPHGVIVAVLQVVDPTLDAVSKSSFRSLELLGPVMRLLDEADVANCATSAGFTLEASRRVTLPSAKAFRVMDFSLSA